MYPAQINSVHFFVSQPIKPSKHSNMRQISGACFVPFLQQCVKVEQLALFQHRTKAQALHRETLAITR